MSEGFSTQSVAKGVWYIEDSRGGVMYLVAGAERALLIDTGWGSAGLNALVATLTPLPVVVVNTHAHPDHMGGNRQFPQVYIHTNDWPQAHAQAQDSGTTLVAIYDGYHFDLGQRQVRVIGVPGHTPGSICLLDSQTRILFSGDSPRPGPIWLHVGTALSVQEFSFSLQRLRTFAGEFDVIAPSHGKPEPAGALIDDLIACAAGILSGKLVGKPQETRFGECLLAELGSAGIMYKADKIYWRFGWMQGERIVSPEVHADRRVTFRVKAPKADRVMLTSGPLMNALGSADAGMAFQDKDAAGVWSLTVGPLPPDLYDYTFVIDGVAMADSNNASVKTGTMSPSSVLTVPADDGPSYYEARDVPHGTLHRHYYTSRTLGDVRDVYVYTPPEYDANPGRSYPVLYLLHGGGDNAAGWSDLGRAHLIMDNLLAEGKARPMIVVMPFGQALPFVAMLATMSVEQAMQKNAALFEQDLFTDIMPLAESTYRIQADRSHRAMAGLSMGGGQTDQIGLSHLETFSHIGILSIGAEGFAERHADLLADPAGTNGKLDLLLLGCGTLDPLATEGMDELHKLLTEKGIDHVYWNYPGAAHTWVVWRSALYYELLPRLWRK